MEKKQCKIFYIDPHYIYYRRLWNDDRWQFNLDFTKLVRKENYNRLTKEDELKLKAMRRVLEENNHDWNAPPKKRKRLGQVKKL